MPGSGRPKSGHPNRGTALDAQNGGPPPGKMLIFQCSEAATDRTDMAKSAEPVTIKKYANRRLYNTGEEITRSVLAQIIFEQENKEGQNLLPIAFLRQLIRFYGDSMQMLVPRFLEASIDSLTREQEKFREQMAQAFGVGSFGPLEDQVRRNMEMFQRAFAMFPGFAPRETPAD